MLTFRSQIALFFILGFVATSARADEVPASVNTPLKLTLNEAIQRALLKNYSIKVEGFNASIASARVTESRGKFDLTLSGNYTSSESYNPQLAGTGGIRPPAAFSQGEDYDINVGGLAPWGLTYRLGTSTANDRSTFNYNGDNFLTFAGVSASQPLLRNFGFTPTMATIRIAQTNRSISEWQFRQTVINTITNVIFAYNDLNFAYANLRSAIRSRDLATQLLEENEKRFKTGSVSKHEVDIVRSRAAQREENILFAEQNVRQTENTLKQLTTDTRNPSLLSEKIVIEEPAPAPIVIVDPAADFRVALEKRPDFQQAKLALKRDNINARLQRNQLLPQVDLTGSYGYNGYDTDLRTSRRQLRNEDYHAYSWGVTVSVPLTFTTERGRYRAARLQERQSEATQEQVEQNIVVLVGNAASQIETTQKRIHATRLARELQQTTLDAELKLLRAGQSSSYYVSQEQQLLTFAEVDEARAQSDYHKALADYDRQLGVTLEKLNVVIQAPR